MTQINNPLKQFFRQPALYIKLPSGGQYWENGSLHPTPNNELPVLPMTAIDEITYRTPDALFNGSAVISVIESCMPNIKNAWKMPTLDLNAILIAIRIASYGSEMIIESSCPSCTVQSEHTLDLHGVMAQNKTPNYGSSIKNGDLEIYFKPTSYEEQNKLNTLQFEQQRIVALLPEAEMPEAEKLEKLNLALKEITKLTLIVIQMSIAGIKTPTAFVTEPEFIAEFLKNCDRTLFNEIKDQAIRLREESDLKPLSIECPECHHKYQQTLTLDSTNFFGIAS